MIEQIPSMLQSETIFIKYKTVFKHKKENIPGSTFGIEMNLT